jgi:hypothetical protein
MTKQISQPDLIDALTELKLDIFYNFNCHKIGRIESFDPANQTATISLIDKRVLESSEGTQLKDYPPLVDVPVHINKGSKGGFTRPIEQGEYCVVLFNDRNIDNWFANGTVNPPLNDKTHDLGDGLALVGFFSGASPLSSFDNQATEMQYEDVKIKLNSSAAEISYKNLEETTKIVLDGKVEISNKLQSLQDLINQLNTLLTNFVMVDNPATPTITVVPNNATQATITQLQNDFNQLLK